MNKENLMETLRNIKNVFLMAKGDFFLHFLELSEVELKKSVDKIDLEKL